MRVATAVGLNPLAIARAPYVRTLWSYLHVCQQERLEAMRERSRQLALATLVMLAFHAPAKLADVRREILVDSGLAPSTDHVIAQSQLLLAEVAKLDAIERAPAPPAPAGFETNAVTSPPTDESAVAGSGQAEA